MRSFGDGYHGGTAVDLAQEFSVSKPKITAALANVKFVAAPYAK